MYCFRTNMSIYWVLILLFPLEYQTVTTSSNLNKIIFHKQPSLVHKHFDQSTNSNTSAATLNNDNNYTSININKQRLLTDFETNISKPDTNNTFKRSEYNNNRDKPSNTIPNNNSLKTSTNQEESQYMHKAKETIVFKNAIVTFTKETSTQTTIDEGKWWTEYYRTLHYKYPWYKPIETSPSATMKKIRMSTDILKSNHREPTRTTYLPLIDTTRNSKAENDNIHISDNSRPYIKVKSDSATLLTSKVDLRSRFKNIQEEKIQWKHVYATFPQTSTSKKRWRTEYYRTWSHIYSKRNQSTKVKKNTVYKQNTMQQKLRKTA